MNSTNGFSIFNTQGDGTLLPTEVQTNVKFEIVIQTAATHIAKCTGCPEPILHF